MTTYQHMNLRDHCLHRPDTYVGSITEEIVEDLIVVDSTTCQMDFRMFPMIPGLVRLYVEVLSNAVDHVWRSASTSTPCQSIIITINHETGETSITNDGAPIPIQKMSDASHTAEYWIPEMLFGRLLTSSNYDDTEQRMTSGRNGLGVSLTNLFSNKFHVRILNAESKQSYTQQWTDHMRTVSSPTIRRSKQSSSTQVTWIPDFTYFHTTGYSNETIALFHRFACDASMTTGVRVTFNGSRVPTRTLKLYAKCYVPASSEMYSMNSEMSHIVICPSTSGFKAISFVNGVYTRQGGVHVDAWMEIILKRLIACIERKYKVKLSSRELKSSLMIFVQCTLPNPTFSSQTKDRLTSPRPPVDVPPAQIEKMLKGFLGPIVQRLLHARELDSLKRTERKSRGHTVIDGLDPANKAGTKESHRCTLILCEGLSAKTYAVLGIQQGVDFGNGQLIRGRDYFGVMALRGKLLNCRNASTKTIASNKEISNIIQALGLQYGKDYTSEEAFRTLRYGRVMCLCDSDCDGYHIQGLILNAFSAMFPSLLKRPGFLYTMQTPIVKVIHQKQTHRFYTLTEAKQFLETHPTVTSVKYYKGLGTSSDIDVRDTFGQCVLEYTYDSTTDETLDKIFHKARAEQRKQWLSQYTPSSSSSFTPNGTYSISTFLNEQMIEYSFSDCKRSLPHLMDGLKESQRKILYAVMKRASHDSLKVAQLAGYVAEVTLYHHGEQCLFDTITKMAQDYVGSNNLPLFTKEGQFGSRLSNGKDAASARYIYTRLHSWTRSLFMGVDDPIVPCQMEEGQPIEPAYYAPILPMVLVNGVSGSIGTGWSCSIPNYNPLDCIQWIRCWLTNTSVPELTPWYRGFKGTIRRLSPTQWETSGVLEPIRGGVRITELPIGMSVDAFKAKLDTLLETKKIGRVQNYCTPTTIHFNVLRIQGPGTLEWFGLTSKLSTSNMVVFLSDGRLVSLNTIDECMQLYCTHRLELYGRRTEYELGQLRDKRFWLDQQRTFLQAILSNELSLDQSESQWNEYLKQKKFKVKNGSYTYLTHLPLHQLTQTQRDRLDRERTQLTRQIRVLEKSTPHSRWMNDLDTFEQLYRSAHLDE
jgi:DNA topoisomerase-2